MGRSRLMSAQKRFARAANVRQSGDEKTLEATLAVAMESPSHIGRPADFQSSPPDNVEVCNLDVRGCPLGWTSANGICAASSDYAGPCAAQLNIVGMGIEQILAVAKYCHLHFPCQ